MTKGAKPKPTNLKVLEGNPGKRGLNENEPTPPTGFPDAPSIVRDNKDAITEWNSQVTSLHAMGVLTLVDVGVFTAYCLSWATLCAARREMNRLESEGLSYLVEHTSNGNTIQSPFVGIANTAAKDMVKHAAELGMTPSARTRIDAKPPKAPSKFEGMIVGKGRS